MATERWITPPEPVTTATESQSQCRASRLSGLSRQSRAFKPSSDATLILILSRSDDEVAQAVGLELLESGLTFRIVDFAFFPSRDRLTLAVSASHGISRSYLNDGVRIDLTSVTSILWRRPPKACAAASFAVPAIRQYIETSSEEALEGFFSDFDGFQVPAKQAVFKAAYAKLPQLSLATELDFALPDTLVTNDPDEMLKFYRQHSGQVITKTASVRAESWLGPMGTGYARFLRPRDLIHYRDIQHCPVIVQAYTDKALEVRVTVIGNSVFAAGIYSQATRRTRVDWRRYDRTNTPHDVHQLPSDVADRCLALIRRMGLSYGAIDLILTPDGDYVFLEVNPNGQYKWIEDLTGLPLTKRLAQLLIHHA